jgi:GTPase
VLLDTDVILFLVDASEWKKEDDWVLQKLQDSATEKPVILVLNKMDLLANKTELLPLIDRLQAKFPFVGIVPISALAAENTDHLENEIIKLLPAGELIFPDDQLTDKSMRFLAAEIIREKLIQQTEEELPYTTAVEIEQFEEKEKIVEISAVIWVERQGQKVIIIGARGSRLKKVGIQARRDIEKLVDKKVFLRLWVKVKADWTDDERALKNLGYE